MTMTYNAQQLPTTSAGMQEPCGSVKPPNRRHFENVLAALNNSITQKDAECTRILGQRIRGDNSSIGELFRLKNEISQIKTERETLRKTQIPQSKSKCDDLDKQIRNAKEEISKIDRHHIWYKNEQMLRSKIKGLEDDYMNSKYNNLREENAMVKEIDKLKRNLKFLEKYKTLDAKIYEMEQTKRAWKNDQNRLFKRNANLKSDLYKLQEQERSCRKHSHELRSDLDRLYAQKKELVMNYEQERQDYIQWSRQNKKAQSSQQRQGDNAVHRTYSGKPLKRTSSWKNPRHNLNDDNSSDSDGDDYEAFSKEKQICRNLMSFLQNFMPEPQKSSSIVANSQEPRQHLSDAQPVTGLKKDESDDETLHQLSASPKQSVKRQTKKDKRKNTTQPIPLEPHVLVDFETVSVPAPVNYIEVPIAFEKLKERLNFYEEQMSLTLNFSYSNDDFAYPSSESEMTADSARFSVMTLSEADDSLSSPAGLSLSQSSYAFDKQQSLIKGQYSFEEIDSPKSIADSPIKIKQKRINRSKSCETKCDDFTPSCIKGLKKCSSLKSLSLSKKIVKGSTYDEGIDVFLSKDSSANSNVLRF